MIPAEFRPFPAGGRELAANIAACSNAFAATATAALLSDPDQTITSLTAPFEEALRSTLRVLSVRWSRGDAERVAALVRSSGLTDEAAAAVLADLLDRKLGPRFDELPAPGSTWELETGDPYPVRVPALSGSGRSSHPHAGPKLGNDLRHLRFLPTIESDWTIRFHWTGQRVAVLPSEGGVLATGHPNTCLEEFGNPGRPTDSTFFAFPDRDPDHRSWVGAVTDLATTNSSIVVLPELCIDQDDIADVVQTWRELPRHSRPNVFVPGSAHVVDGAASVNRAEIHIGGLGSPILVDKQEPFPYEDLMEGIDVTPRSIDVHVVAGWRIVGAICRDVLRPFLPELLAQLGTTLLLVPAMSPSIETFEGLNTIPIRNWGIAVVSNNPSRWPRRPPHHPDERTPPQVLVAWPREHPGGLTEVAGHGSSAVRGAWKLDVTAGTVTPVT